MFEGGVHFVAGLRLVCTRLGWGDAEEVSALAGHAESGLPGPDTVQGWVKFGNCQAATVSFTFAARHRHFRLAIVCTRGTVSVERAGAGYSITQGDHKEHVNFAGVDNELEHFVAEVQKNQLQAVQRRRLDFPSDLGAAAEGAWDVAVMEALLESGRNEGRIVRVDGPS